VKKIESDIALGKFLIEADDVIQYTFSQLILQFRKFSKNNKSIQTVERQDYGIKPFVDFLKDDIYLSEITTQTVENYRDNRINKGTSPTTVSIELKILKTLFNYGVKNSMVGRNPANGIVVLNQRKNKIRFLNEDEIKNLLQIIKEDDNIDFYYLVETYLKTGARRTELLPPLFNWENIDFLNKTVLFRGIKKNKDRWIPFHDTLNNIFLTIKKYGSKHPFDYKPNYVTHKIQNYYKSAGIKGANLNSLRKSFGSRLLQEGESIFMVSKLLGHSSVKTTEKYYADYKDDNYRSATKRLE
jgi:site-specific recombinase XerD